MTPAQLQTLKTNIAADGVLAAKPMHDSGRQEIATAYNLPASPNFTVWKTNVPVSQIGDNFWGSELAGMTTGNQTRLQTIALYSPDGINPSLLDRRAMFDDIFSGAGGTNTRPKLLALWKRLATRAEKLYANTSGGNGADATPATLVFEGQVTMRDVQEARDLA